MIAGRAMIGYALKRMLMVLAGCLVAVLVGLIALVAIYVVLSSLPNAPGLFRADAVHARRGARGHWSSPDRRVLFAAGLLAARAVRRRRGCWRLHAALA
ncbi:exported hypothetical protein [Mesorhizobium sp. ORS 3324]|nr:exported hypothetical protein [Mesorhizobium sp. ORS 3324]